METFSLGQLVMFKGEYKLSAKGEYKIKKHKPYPGVIVGKARARDLSGNVIDFYLVAIDLHTAHLKVPEKLITQEDTDATK